MAEKAVEQERKDERIKKEEGRKSLVGQEQFLLTSINFNRHKVCNWQEQFSET